MKRLIVFLFLILCGVAHSAQIVNVEYIHNAIKQKWDITVPYNTELTNPRVAANMKYLLTTVDVANEMLNGEPTSDYGNGEYATLFAADTIATDVAVETLVQMDSNDYKFFATVSIPKSGFYFDFNARANGDFFINWGDGSPTEYVTNPDGIIHMYASPGKYNIKFGGLATGAPETSVDFYGFKFECDYYGYADCVTEISGCLGCIFPTLPDGTNPSFRLLLHYSPITAIPDGLFAGLHGDFENNMFEYAFSYTNITAIPENLFADLSTQRSTVGAFSRAFANTPITSIPENLFSGVTLATSRMFNGTFSYTNITEIPAGLFSSLSTVSGLDAFSGTFSNTPITSIPENLFAGIECNAYGTFSYTFSGTNITSIPEKLFANIVWNDEYPDSTFRSTFEYTPITSIPENLFDSFLEMDYFAMSWVFEATFSGCERLETLPNNLFAGLRWDMLEHYSGGIFYWTFGNCSSLTEIPDNLFGDVVLNLSNGMEYAYENSFAETFSGSIGLSGASARTGGQYFYEKWPDAPESIFTGMYYGATGLSDYDNIPEAWK